MSKTKGTKLGAKDIPTESISDDITTTSTDGMTNLTPYTAPGWSTPVKQTRCGYTSEQTVRKHTVVTGNTASHTTWRKGVTQREYRAKDPYLQT